MIRAFFAVFLAATACAAESSVGPLFQSARSLGGRVIRAGGSRAKSLGEAARYRCRWRRECLPNWPPDGTTFPPCAPGSRAGFLKRSATRPKTPAPSAAESPRQGPKVLNASDSADRDPHPRFDRANHWTDEPRSISAIATGKPLVIANVSTSCPISKRYAPTLLALQKDRPRSGIPLSSPRTRRTRSAALREALPGAPSPGIHPARFSGRWARNPPRTPSSSMRAARSNIAARSMTNTASAIRSMRRGRATCRRARRRARRPQFQRSPRPKRPGASWISPPRRRPRQRRHLPQPHLPHDAAALPGMSSRRRGRAVRAGDVRAGVASTRA